MPCIKQHACRRGDRYTVAVSSRSRCWQANPCVSNAGQRCKIEHAYCVSQPITARRSSLNARSVCFRCQPGRRSSLGHRRQGAGVSRPETASSDASGSAGGLTATVGLSGNDLVKRPERSWRWSLAGPWSAQTDGQTVPSVTIRHRHARAGGRLTDGPARDPCPRATLRLTSRRRGPISGVGPFWPAGWTVTARRPRPAGWRERWSGRLELEENSMTAQLMRAQ